jgi:hypothetical protein
LSPGVLPVFRGGLLALLREAGLYVGRLYLI